MKIIVHTINAAAANSNAARIRESTRMCILARGFQNLGLDVAICSVPDVLRESNRFASFEPLVNWDAEPSGDDVLVIPAEVLINGPQEHHPLVAVKCSVNGRADNVYCYSADVVVAHEYHPGVSGRNELLPVPFLVHDRVIQHFCDDGLMEHYLSDDLQALRRHYACEKRGKVGFAGVGHFGRKDIIKQLPDYVEREMHDTPRMSAGEYMHWLAGFEAGIVPNGDTPKTNRFSELVLLGLPTIAPPCPVKNTPPVTAENSILLRDWSDRDTLEQGLRRKEEIVAAADRCYLEGWGPTGQARQVCRKLGIPVDEPVNDPDGPRCMSNDSMGDEEEAL